MKSPKEITSEEAALPLLMFQVSIGMRDRLIDEHGMKQIQENLDVLKISGFRLFFISVPDFDSNKTDFKLLWPINNSLISEKDLLDLLTRHGYVPPIILEEIRNEINK